MSKLPIPERVDNGIRWLDEHRPGWDQVVDLARLNLARCDACIIGQLCAPHPGLSYNDVICEPGLGTFALKEAEAMFLFSMTRRLNYREAIRLGFTLEENNGQWNLLQREWEIRIEERWAA